MASLHARMYVRMCMILACSEVQRHAGAPRAETVVCMAALEPWSNRITADNDQFPYLRLLCAYTTKDFEVSIFFCLTH